MPPTADNGEYQRGLETLSRFLVQLSDSLGHTVSKKNARFSETSRRAASLAQTCTKLSKLPGSEPVPRPPYVGPLCTKATHEISAHLGIDRSGIMSVAAYKRLKKSVPNRTDTVDVALNAVDESLVRTRDMLLSSVCGARGGAVLEIGSDEDVRRITDTVDGGIWRNPGGDTAGRISVLCNLYHNSSATLASSFGSSDKVLERESLSDCMARVFFEAGKNVRPIEDFFSKHKDVDNNLGLDMARCRYYAMETPEAGDRTAREAWADVACRAIPYMPAEICAHAIIAVRSIAVSRRDKALAARVEASVSEIPADKATDCAHLDAVRSAVITELKSGQRGSKRDSKSSSSSRRGASGRNESRRGAHEHGRGGSRGGSHGRDDDRSASSRDGRRGRSRDRDGHHNGNDPGKSSSRRAGSDTDSRRGGARSSHSNSRRSHSGSNKYADEYANPYGSEQDEEEPSTWSWWTALIPSFGGDDDGDDGYYSDDPYAANEGGSNYGGRSRRGGDDEYDNRSSSKARDSRKRETGRRDNSRDSHQRQDEGSSRGRSHSRRGETDSRSGGRGSRDASRRR